jgi:exosortase E/protease (VPEID-CTERM system)
VSLVAAMATAAPVVGACVPLVRWRRAAPAAVLGAIAFAVGDSFDGIGGGLARVTIHGVGALLDVTGRSVVFHPVDRIVGTERFAVLIAPHCAGTEGLGLMIVFAGGAIAWFRRELRWPRALCVVPAALASTLTMNAVRIAALILVGDAGAHDLALGAFHSRAGWVFFCGIAAGVVLVVRRASWLRRETVAPRDPAVARYVAPQLALLAATLAGPLFSGREDFTYALAAAAATLALLAVRPPRVKPPKLWPAGVGLAVYLMWRALEPAAAPEAHPHGRWLLHALVSVLVTPIVEELAFRGYLLRRLMGRDFDAADPRRAPPWAILVSTAIFAAGHGRFLAAFLAGIAFAWVYRRRGRLSDAILAHAIANAAIAAEVLLAGRWSYW